MMTPADKGLLRQILWYCDPEDEDGPLQMIATLAHFGGCSVVMPVRGRLDYDDWLVLTDRITRFFLVIHGSHLFPGAPDVLR